MQAIPEILDRDHPVLRGVAKEIPAAEIRSDKIREIIYAMRAALATQEDGVAIAAPQIGVPLRIFVVAAKAFAYEEDRRREREKAPEDEPMKRFADKVFINPIVTRASREKMWMEEGCLSVRWLYGKVRRSKKASVRAYDENGKLFTMDGVGLLAQIFQHETDHLDGILFIDKAKDVEELTPEERPR
jgi:peptide deformylase